MSYSLVDAGPVSTLNLIYDQDVAVYQVKWQAQSQIYDANWEYWSGAVFNNAMWKDRSGKPSPKKFPLKINVVKKACLTHSMHLWGLTSNLPFLRSTVIPKRDKIQAEIDRCKNMEDYFDTFLQYSNGETKLREAGRMYMALGGTALKVRRDSGNPCGVSLDSIPVAYFFPVWNPGNYDELIRCHIAYQIEKGLAKILYGYRDSKNSPDMVDFVETWTLDKWSCAVGPMGDRQPAVDQTSHEVMEGPNVFQNPVTKKKYIPIIYIPRLRTGSFYGDPLPADLMGLQDEYNARMADQGDAVSQASHMHVYGHDITRRGTPDLKVPVGNTIYDAGDTQVGGEAPFLGILSGPNLAEAGSKFSSQLEDALYDQAGIPPVMRGIDEGSQRSALTLAARALPTLSIIEDYRASWVQGLRQCFELFQMACYADAGNMDMGLNDVSHLDFGHIVMINFAPVLPKDIAQINETITQQRAAGVMSKDRAVRLSPDVTDPDAELKKIEEEEKAKAKAEQEKNQKMADAKMEQMQVQGEMQAANDQSKIITQAKVAPKPVPKKPGSGA